MSYHFQNLGEFGQAGAGIVIAAIGNVAVSAHHAVAVSKLHAGFEKKLDSDAQKMDYIRTLLLRFKSLGARLARTTRPRPGSKEFEVLLKHAMRHDMTYKGHCNADIFVPMSSKDTVGQPRSTWASISRTGFVSGGRVPKDVGPIWASGCKSAQDEFRIAFIKKQKGGQKFEHLKAHKEDIGTMNLFLKFGTGLFLVIVMVIVMKIQGAVIEEQEYLEPPKKKRKKKRPAGKKKRPAGKKKKKKATT